jgi:hypothetical protein
MKTYKGFYKIRNESKYIGDPKNVVYRSGWEQAVMRWCDDNPNVVQWGSEEVVIPYICETDKKLHRYFIDFMIKYKDGRTVLVEVKPHKETVKPKNVQGKARRQVINETLTYIKNISKWTATEKYVADKGWHFEIWDEHKLRALNILPKPLGKKQFKPLKKMNPYRKPKK